MLQSAYWASFALATLAFACMPGPAILYMTSQTLAHGRRSGLHAALGIHLGCYLHILAASAGLAALLHHAPTLYLGLKLAGAAYLIWLGGSMILGQRRLLEGAEEVAEAHPQVLRDSIVVEMLNPKTALFFLTFLPQFVDPAASLPVGLQFFILGVIVNLVFSSADVLAVLFASLLLGVLGEGRGKRLMPRVCGSILVGLGVMLAARGGPV
ncbi:LysE family translocator [Pseudomonas sp. LA21]|uniref:LysE family translocator n=1 Tax=unclassified Pseudomonas TaxID=196821 RepID=UPI001FB6637C|nr:LysE family translocator [Pseudomonas sp. LA21]MCJ1888192.1 LysE family translocator [Pseudomonas sp. LA21]